MASSKKKTSKKTAGKTAAQKKKDAAAKKKQREEEKARKAAEREKNRMPEQNGVRRPKPDTACGQAWAIFDAISKKRRGPASIGEAMEQAKAAKLNEGNVRAEYARWRKFNGVSGRVANPAKAKG